jgi:hypothetical protein
MILDPARITFPLKPIIFDEEVNVVRACFRYFRQCFDESWSCVAILLGSFFLNRQDLLPGCCNTSAYYLPVVSVAVRSWHDPATRPAEPLGSDADCVTPEYHHESQL